MGEIYTTSKKFNAVLSNELIQDLKAIQGFDAEKELVEIISTEISQELDEFLKSNHYVYDISAVRFIDDRTFAPSLGFIMRYAEV